MSKPLRYRISHWTQLSECKSNYSAALHVRVADFVNDSRLVGERITIYHEEFGELFSAMLAASGTIVNPSIPCCVSDADVLRELERFGFLVEYTPIAHLSPKLLQILITLDGLGYDKIRVLHLKQLPSTAKFDKAVIAFKVSEHPQWLDNLYVATYREYVEATADGSAYAFYTVSREEQFEWSWLDFVANISDILRENSYEVESDSVEGK